MAKWGDKLTEKRLGCMVHYTGGKVDSADVKWMRSPACTVSYQWLVLDNGNAERIAPDDKRAYHAGVCKPSDPRLNYKDANSAFYGIAITATAGDTITGPAFRTVVRLCLQYFAAHGWQAHETWRITGHHAEAWPRGRKVDPVGPDPSKPVVDLEVVRAAVAGVL